MRKLRTSKARLVKVLRSPNFQTFGIAKLLEEFFLLDYSSGVANTLLTGGGGHKFIHASTCIHEYVPPSVIEFATLLDYFVVV